MKEFWKSKVFWFNICSIALLVVGYLTDNKIITSEIGVLSIAIINIVLRFLTSQALTMNKPIKD